MCSAVLPSAVCDIDSPSCFAQQSICPVDERLSFPPKGDPTSWATPGSLAAVSAAIAVAAVGVFAVTAGSVADAVAPPAVFAVRWRAGSPVAGAPGPASAAVYLVPLADSQLACPAAADTFGPASPCLYLERSV